MSSEVPVIPTTVLEAYFGDADVSTSPLGAGEINATFLATSSPNRAVVMQRMSPIFGKAVLQDFNVVTNHLGNNGWEVPRTVSTTNGDSHVEDETGNIWRSMTFIQSDTESGQQPSAELYGDYGSILGKLHSGLATLKYEPAFTLPHFHDTQYHMDRLSKLKADLPDEETQTFAENILGAYAQLPELPDDTMQLIHGDPRTSNVLMRGNKPFTYIDWDTVMQGSTWVDLGDMLRSMSEDAIVQGRQVPTNMLHDVINGYRAVAAPDADLIEFTAKSLEAMQQIALELASRYVYDIVDDNYWVWDQSNYSTRRDSNLARARTQWQVYEAGNTAKSEEN